MDERKELRKEREERLNKIGLEWYNTPPEGNEALRKSLEAEIFRLALLLFSKQDKKADMMEANEVMTDFYFTDWLRNCKEVLEEGKPAEYRFDPAKGTMYGFFVKRLHWRRQDLEEENLDGEEVDEEKEETGEPETDGPENGEPETGGPKKKKKKHVRPNLSLDELRSDGSNLLQKMAAPVSTWEDRGTQLEGRWLELMLLMFELEDHLTGQANNSVRRSMFRLFFTDGVITGIKDDAVDRENFEKRRTELFRAIAVPFLDYVMRAPCRSVQEIVDTELKLYGELAEGEEMAPVRRPLPHKVFAAYKQRVEHERITEVRVSQLEDAYWYFIKKELKYRVPKKKKQTRAPRKVELT